MSIALHQPGLRLHGGLPDHQGKHQRGQSLMPFQSPRRTILVGATKRFQKLSLDEKSADIYA
ncbi:hypothetical protein [Polaromonas vacuolata]|uniref:hypothetical protein n=1 Tax=Polaromonas vacuolata TaxID=37448 RepID=UPI001456F366|nr:hypothetical protein [Polaromonas vacuolata]